MIGRNPGPCVSAGLPKGFATLQFELSFGFSTCLWADRLPKWFATLQCLSLMVRWSSNPLRFCFYNIYNIYVQHSTRFVFVLVYLFLRGCGSIGTFYIDFVSDFGFVTNSFFMDSTVINDRPTDFRHLERLGSGPVDSTILAVYTTPYVPSARGLGHGGRWPLPCLLY